MNANQNNAEKSLTTLQGAVASELHRIGWQFDDVKKSLAQAAQSMLRRAQEAADDCERMMADQPCSLSWVEFAEGDLRHAREAKARIRALGDQKTLLDYLARKAASGQSIKCMNCGCETDADVCERCAANGD
jgi:hypothetical protein